MNRVAIGGYQRMGMQFWRETAQNAGRAIATIAAATNACERSSAGRVSSKNRSAYCQNRYPSPGRSVVSNNRPVAFFAGQMGGNLTDIGYHLQRGVEFHQQNADSARTFKLNKGRTLCLTKHGSLPPLRHSRSLAVSNLIWSVALPVPLQAQSQQTPQALTQQLAHLPVHLLASCVTTQASAAAHAKNTRAHGRDRNHHDRRRGHSPAAVVCLKDCQHV